MKLSSIRLTFSQLHDPARWISIALYSLLFLFWLVFPQLLIQHTLFFGLGLLLSADLLLTYRSRNYLVLLDLLPLLCVLTMWVAPALQYWLEARAWPIGPDAMRMPADAYFRLVIPGVLALGLGIHLGLPFLAGHDRARLEHSAAMFSQPGAVLFSLAIGLLGWLLSWIVPSWLHLLTVFMQLFLWVALYQVVLLPRMHLKILAFGALCVVIMLSAMYSTMFGDMVFGLIIANMYVQVRRGWRMRRLLLLQLVAVLLVGWLLSFKYEYRRAVQRENTWLGLGRQFGLSAAQSLSTANMTININHVLARVNQGNVTAMVYKYVPQQQPFVEGETVRTALLGMLVPRLFWPDKPQAGGVENIRRFMGIPKLHYSINMGTLGEAYVNYGPGPGSVLYLFLYGWVLSALFDGFRRCSDRLPLLFFCLPLVFLPALTVETDLLMVANHVFKAGVLVGAVAWLSRRYER